jgi:D-amino-acid dehydrogenase
MSELPSVIPPSLPAQANDADVIVIGAGVIGMSTAYDLAKRGARVTVIDRGEPGMGCSYGNAGWITPCFAMPLPQPGMLLKSLKWLTNPDSPLYIKPEPSLLLLRWLWRFMRSMNRPLMLQSIDSLVEISKFSVDAYAKLDEETRAAGMSIGFERKGLLMVGETLAGVRAAREEMELVARNGVAGKLMSEAEVRAFEPALTGPLRGGVYFPDEAHAEPLQVVRALAAGAKKHGANILTRTEVFDFYEERGRLTGLRTTRGDLRAKKYVLATGSWSVPLARKLGINVPILGGKGYAIIVPPIDPQPRVPIMVVERKLAITPRDGALRLAGTLELVDRDEGITSRRVDAILNASKLAMNVPQNPEILEVWRGLRPCTPDGVPVIGSPKRLSNLVVVTGHQMLGLQSAPGTGRLAADLVLEAQPTFDPKPFRADRF